MQKLIRFFFIARTIPAIFLFFSVQGRIGLEKASLVGAIYALFYIIIARGKGEVSKLDYGMGMFWTAGLAALAVHSRTGYQYFNEYFTTFLYLALFGAAFFPLVVRAEPFTAVFARRNTPQELWRTDQFLAVNRVMSFLWASLFLIAAVVSLLPTLWCKVVLPVAIMIIVGIPLNKCFPDFYLRRHAQMKKPVHPQEDNMPETAGVEQLQKPSWSRSLRDEKRQEIAVREGKISKALVIFGSPRGEKGYTFQLLFHFLKGLHEGGVEYELVPLAEKKIKPCSGCFTCWTKTPGTCIHRDDMAELLDKMNEVDLVVYAQPLYVFSVPGITKNFLDRLLPRLQPFLVEGSDGVTRHPLRWKEGSAGRMCIFSVCGFPEVAHFQPMLDMFRAMAENSGAAIVGELLRPASESLLFGKQHGRQYEKLLADLYASGRQMAGQGYVERELEEQVSGSFVRNVAGFRQVANMMWSTMVEYEAKKRSEGGLSLPSRTEYLLNHPRLLFGGMASMFDPRKAGGLKGTVQFEVVDRKSGSYYLEITGDACTCREGKAEKPDLTVLTPWDIWFSISRGELSGQEAYRQGQYRVEGDLSLLTKLREAMA